MFVGFFYLLRQRGFGVSLNEWMTLMEGLLLGLHRSTLTGFYDLCRAVLVKSEADSVSYTHLDVYKRQEMISAIQDETVRRIFSARIKSEAEVKRERVAEGIVATTAGAGSVKKQPRKVQKLSLIHI